MRAVDGLKRCSKCGEVKSYSYYAKNKSRYDGVSGYCKICQNKCKINSVNKNKLHYMDYNKNYDKINPDSVRDRKRKYTDSNKHKINEYNRLYTLTIPDAIIIRNMKRDTGIQSDLIPPELIEIKRTIIKTKRLCRTLKNSEVN